MLRRLLSWVLFLATFAWLFAGDPKGAAAALWPSVVALGLAFLTRDVYLALFAGALSGAILLQGGNVPQAFLDLFARYMIPALQDPWNVCVLIFTLMMGGLVEILNRNGSMTGLAEWAVGAGQNRRRAGLSTYLFGWLLFFDGLANSMLVGKTMRPMADRVGLSRAKLAFIVDSTSSPIAGLSLISTWVAYEMSMIREGLVGVSWATPGISFQLLVQSFPYRYYNYFLLVLVFLSIWLGRDFRAMREAESAARAVPIPPDTPDQSRGVGSHLWLAAVPLLTLILGVAVGLFADGGGFGRPFSLDSVIAAYGQANAAMVFVWATALATVVAIVLSSIAVKTSRPFVPLFEGMQHMFLPTLILVFAWTLNGVIKEIGTAAYLGSLLGEGTSARWLPAAVFILAAWVSFCTGTSWGTMALVMPLVIPLAVQIHPEGVSNLLIATVGSVLAGAVFGDHCSPISDTTIVSALSSGCDVMEHVRTQLPYAMAAAALAAVVGYGPAGWGISPYPLLVLGGVGCWALLRFLAR